jgi:L-2-hydroxyglutarate oxidase
MVHDYCVIGGGIVGLASARQLLLEFPGASVVVLEKEGAPGRHQTGHNSGVIHAGVYYQPGSLKARLCKAGASETKAFCDRQGIKYETRGKLIVATDAAERERMEALYERALGNSIEIVRLSGSELQERERNIRGVGALLVPASGIVDYGQICLALATEIRSLGGEIVFNSEVDSIEETRDGVHVTAGPKTYHCGRLIACAGLQSDRLARRAGLQIDHQIVPFRGNITTSGPGGAALCIT